MAYFGESILCVTISLDSFGYHKIRTPAQLSHTAFAAFLFFVCQLTTPANYAISNLISIYFLTFMFAVKQRQRTLTQMQSKLFCTTLTHTHTRAIIWIFSLVGSAFVAHLHNILTTFHAVHCLFVSSFASCAPVCLFVCALAAGQQGISSFMLVARGRKRVGGARSLVCIHTAICLLLKWVNGRMSLTRCWNLGQRAVRAKI